MYSNKFVVAILVDGNILQEKSNGVTPIPFNSEYKIRLRNKHNRRCAAEIYVDGQCATKAGRIVINANDYVDVERFVSSQYSGNSKCLPGSRSSCDDTQPLYHSNGGRNLLWVDSLSI